MSSKKEAFPASKGKRIFGACAGKTFDGFLNLLSKRIRTSPDWVAKEDYKSENFYGGHKTFIAEPAQGAVWSLGYSQRSLIPDDFYDFENRTYYMAGYLTIPAKKLVRNLDDMKVRTIVMDDGSGRGKVVQAVLDSVGLSNTDVRVIRSRLADFAKDNNIVSINISTTHSHSCIDTQGLWGPLGKSMKNNRKVTKKGEGEILSGRDPAFMENLYKKTADSIKEACKNMLQGEMYYSTRSIEGYLSDKRMPVRIINEIYRLRFLPFNKAAKQTYIINFGAHPETTGIKTKTNPGNEQSSDFVHYMEEEINKAGHNMLFIQGALGGLIACSRGITNDGLNREKIGEKYNESGRHQETKRWGWELGKISLAMTMDKETAIKEIVNLEEEKAEISTLKNPQAYTRWYENWQRVDEVKVEPILNISFKEIDVSLDNALINLIAKYRLVNNIVLYSDKRKKKLHTITEVGYMEIGRNIKAVMMPGELFPELVIGGGGADKTHAYSGKDFLYPPMQDMVKGDLMAFGLANDSIGYIVPDNDFGNIFVGKYEEMLSFSSMAASTLVGAFKEIVESVERK